MNLSLMSHDDVTGTGASATSMLKKKISFHDTTEGNTCAQDSKRRAPGRAAGPARTSPLGGPRSPGARNGKST